MEILDGNHRQRGSSRAVEQRQVRRADGAVQAHGYLPILFDFDKPANRHLTETVSTLGHLSRFVIADLSEARSIPQEVERLVPRLPSVVFRPIIAADDEPWAM